ncbi:MAG: malate dehydrogenase [Actinobacteria bacterium]|nr:malate dehydrogenase [Actinomycetota bacterium]
MPLPKVTVVGAGQVGATLAFMLLGRELADVVLIDVAEGLPQGKALDMMHARSIDRFAPSVLGTNDYADTAGSEIVVITAGLPRKPGMTRDDLLAANTSIVRSVVEQALQASPEALFLIVTNPLDVMTYLAWKVSGLPHDRVFGMGGVLDSARFSHAIAEHMGVSPASIEAVVCGAHGDAMVPLPSQSLVAGTPVSELLPPEDIAKVVNRTVYGGAEVVGLLKSGSAFYAPAASVAHTLAAILGGKRVQLPSCVYLTGQYGINDVYMSVPAVIGRGGVEEISEMELSSEELAMLQASAESIAESLRALGL